jgi:hypothetical protein
VDVPIFTNTLVGILRPDPINESILERGVFDVSYWTRQANVSEYKVYERRDYTGRAVSWVTVAKSERQGKDWCFVLLPPGSESGEIRDG